MQAILVKMHINADGELVTSNTVTIANKCVTSFVLIEYSILSSSILEIQTFGQLRPIFCKISIDVEYFNFKSKSKFEPAYNLIKKMFHFPFIDIHRLHVKNVPSIFGITFDNSGWLSQTFISIHL